MSLKVLDLPVSLVKRFFTNPDTKRDTFLIGFKLSDKIELEELRLHKTLFSTLVSWKDFEERSISVRQCFKCNRLGHSSSGCVAPASCVLCAKEHLKSQCPLPKMPDGKVDSKHLCCTLCGGKHTASYSKCPIRIKYVEALESRKPVTNSAPVAAPSTSWASLPPTTNAWPSLPSSADATVPQSSVSPPQQTNSLSETTSFTQQELWNIFLEFSRCLASCKTKNEQIVAVAQLAFKYTLPEGRNPVISDVTGSPNKQPDLPESPKRTTTTPNVNKVLSNTTAVLPTSPNMENVNKQKTGQISPNESSQSPMRTLNNPGVDKTQRVLRPRLKNLEGTSAFQE